MFAEGETAVYEPADLLYRRLEFLAAAAENALKKLLLLFKISGQSSSVLAREKDA